MFKKKSNFNTSFYNSPKEVEKEIGKSRFGFYLFLSILLIGGYMIFHFGRHEIVKLYNESQLPKNLSNFIASSESKANLEYIKTPIIPNKTYTPGVMYKLDEKTICSPSFKPMIQNSITQENANQIFKNYKVDQKDHILYFLIPPTLGGVFDVRNVFPLTTTPPGFHEKAWLDNILFKEVCANKIALPQAQACLLNNWWTCYKNVIMQPK